MDALVSLFAMGLLVLSYRTLFLNDKQKELTRASIGILFVSWVFAWFTHCQASFWFTIPLSLLVNLFVYFTIGDKDDLARLFRGWVR